MRRHKRNIVIAGLVLGLAALGLIQGPAHAGSSWCTDGGYPGEVNTQISPTGSPVYLAGQVFTGPTHYGGGVCYAMPFGVAGGIEWTQATVDSDATGDRTVWGFVRCDPDGGFVTPGCGIYYSLDTTDDGNLDTNGKATDASASGSAGGVNVGSTGAFVGTPGTPTDLPGDGDTTTSAAADSGTGTCAWVNGIPTCPPGTTIAGITVNEADALDPNTPGTGCWLGVGSTCAVQNSGIGIGQDGGDTLTGTVAGIDVPANVPNECVNVGASC